MLHVSEVLVTALRDASCLSAGCLCAVQSGMPQCASCSAARDKDVEFVIVCPSGMLTRNSTVYPNKAHCDAALL